MTTLEIVKPSEFDPNAPDYIEPEQIEPILSLVSVTPIRQPLKINDTIHWLNPMQGYGVVSQMEIQRDWDTYKKFADRVKSGETLTHDEAVLGDLAAERLVRFAIPTMGDDEWQGLDGSDKLAVCSLFFEITRLTDEARAAKSASLSPRSITQK